MVARMEMLTWIKVEGRAWGAAEQSVGSCRNILHEKHENEMDTSICSFGFRSLSNITIKSCYCCLIVGEVHVSYPCLTLTSI
jgi:hypothetical protein